MRKKRIASDFNGVIADTRDGVRRFLEHKTGLVIPRQCDCRAAIVGEERDWSAVLEDADLMAEYRTLIDEFYTTDLFFEWIEPRRDAIPIIRRLREREWEFIVVSKVRSTPINTFDEWLRRKGIADIEHLLLRGSDKTPHYVKADIALDDEVEYLEPLVNMEHCNTLPLHMVSEYPTARHLTEVDPKFPVRRINSWYEVLQIATDLEGLRRAA